MADGYYTNTTYPYTEFYLYNIVPKPTGIKTIKSKAAKWGRMARMEVFIELGENFEIPDPEIYKNDRFAIAMRHPLYQFAPLNFTTHLEGDFGGRMYLQGGNMEGIYELHVTPRFDQSRNFWCLTNWTIQTEFGRNGRVEKVCLEYPHDQGYEPWKGAWIQVWGEYECVAQPPTSLLDRLMGKEPAMPALVDYKAILEKEGAIESSIA